MAEYYQCPRCGKTGTLEEMIGHHHSPDTTSFLVGTVVGFIAAFFVFTTIGRKLVLTGMGFAKTKVEGLTKELEAKLPKV